MIGPTTAISVVPILSSQQKIHKLIQKWETNEAKVKDSLLSKEGMVPVYLSRWSYCISSYVGTCPNTPQNAAGTRIDPARSDPRKTVNNSKTRVDWVRHIPSSKGDRRPPTAAAHPPEEPPQERVRSNGFLVFPYLE